MKRSLSVNTVFNIIYKVLVPIFPLVTSMYVSRILGAQIIGEITYSQNIAAYFVAFASLGIPTYGIRELSNCRNREDEFNKVFNEIFFINGMSTIIASFLYIFMLLFWKNIFKNTILYIISGLTIFMNFLNVDYYFSAKEEYAYICLRSIAVKIISLLALIFIVKRKDDYLFYAGCIVIASVGNYLINFSKIRKEISLKAKFYNFHRHLYPIFVLFIVTIATDLYNQIDVTMIGAMRASEEVSYYTYSIRIVKMVCTVVTTISWTILPRMCGYYENDENNLFNQLFNKTYEIIFLLALPCTIGIGVLKREIVELLWGKDFMPAADVLGFISPIILIISFSHLVGSVVLTATKNENKLLLATVSGAGVNVVLNYIFIPFYGMSGAAFASIGSELIVCFIHFWYGHFYFKCKLNKHNILTILMACMGMLLSVLLVKVMVQILWAKLVLSIIVGGCTYFCILVIFRNTIIINMYDRIKQKVTK